MRSFSITAIIQRLKNNNTSKCDSSLHELQGFTHFCTYFLSNATQVQVFHYETFIRVFLVMLTAPPRGKIDRPSGRKRGTVDPVDWVPQPLGWCWNRLPEPSLSADPPEMGCWLQTERVGVGGEENIIFWTCNTTQTANSKRHPHKSHFLDCSHRWPLR